MHILGDSFETIVKYKLSDYGLDSRHLSPREARELQLAKRTTIVLKTSILAHSKHIEDDIKEIQKLEWLCILLQEHIDTMSRFLKLSTNQDK